MASTVVHKRVITGWAGSPTPTLERDKGWIDIAQPLGPFGYDCPKPAPGKKRQWRLYAVYYDENSGGQVNVQVKFRFYDGTESPIFTLPRVASGQGVQADGMSDTIQFGDGSAEAVNYQHAICQARLNSTAPYNNHGQIYWLELWAYDCD